MISARILVDSILHIPDPHGKYASLAAEMVGDGGSPNTFFVSRSESIMGEDGSEFRSGKYEFYMMTTDLDEAASEAKRIALSPTGWSRIEVEDRQNGVIYERYLELRNGSYVKRTFDDFQMAR